MKQDFSEKFGAVVIGNISTDPDSVISSLEMEEGFLIPQSLRKLFTSFRGAIVFEKDVRFKPSQKTFLEDANGYHGLELIYGVAQDKNGLKEKNMVYKDQLDNALWAIGECAGGNLICIEKVTGEIIFWNHEATADKSSIFRIAQNFDDFMSRLVVIPEAQEHGKTGGIISGKSFLDF